MLKRHFSKPNLNETSHVYVIRRVITGRLWNDRIALMKSCVNFKDFLYSHGKMDLLRFSIKSDLDRKFSRNLEDLSFIQTSISCAKVQCGNNKIIYGIFLGIKWNASISKIRSKTSCNLMMRRIGGHLLTFLSIGRIWKMYRLNKTQLYLLLYF